MNDDRRNPYVILGIPFGSSAEEARGGFAEMTRKIRGLASPLYRQEDLTWALHQIEQLMADPTLAVHVYRIPANPEALDSEAIGCFNPQPHALPRSTEPPSAVDLDGLRRQSVAHRLAHELRAAGVRTEDGMPFDFVKD